MSQDQNLGKPADAETINGEQDKTTPDNPPKQDDAPNKETSAPVKTASDFARERIMRRQLKELESKKTDDDDDDVSPEDAELVEKVV